MSWFGDFMSSWFGGWGGASAPAGEMVAEGFCGAVGDASASVLHGAVVEVAGGGTYYVRPIKHRRMPAVMADGQCGAVGAVLASVSVPAAPATAVAAAVVQPRRVPAHATGHSGSSANASPRVRTALRLAGRAASRGRALPGVIRNDEAEVLALILAIDHHHRMAA